MSSKDWIDKTTTKPAKTDRQDTTGKRAQLVEAGRITAHGDHKALLQQDNLYSRYWGDIALAVRS